MLAAIKMPNRDVFVDDSGRMSRIRPESAAASERWPTRSVEERRDY
jgi:hypothetical protein